LLLATLRHDRDAEIQKEKGVSQAFTD